MASEPLRGINLILVTISLSLAAFMIVLDTSIANVSIPYIAGDLAVSVNQGTWVITSFAVGNAIALPITGWLTVRIGAVRLIVATMLLFTFFSWLCGASFNYPMLLISRFFQGFVGGPLIPLSQSLLLQSYPAEKRNFANAIFLIVIVVAPIIGPILGGWITFDYTWQWIFYINVPVGILAAFICWPLLRSRETQTQPVPCDWIGLILLTVAVCCLQIFLDKGEQFDWFESPIIKTLSATSLIAFVFLIIWERYEKRPLIDLSLFRNRNFSLGVWMVLLLFMIFYGAIVITPLWLQTQMGYTAYWAGLAVSPMGVFPLFLSIPIANLMNKVSPVIILRVCCILLAITFYLFIFLDTDVSFKVIAFSRLMLGLSLAIFFNPLIAISLQDIPRDNLPSATGIFYFFRTMGISTGTSLFVYLWDRRAIFHHFHMVELLTPYSQNTGRAYSRLDQLRIMKEQGTGVLNDIVDQQAVMLATNDIFWLSSILCVGLIFATFVFKKKKAQPGTQTQVATHIGE